MTSMVQVRLASGATRRTCWVDQTRRFRIGDEITLKKSEDDQRRWIVLSISEPKGADLIHTNWKVGGL
jgi:hypothetical protein